MNLEVSNCPLGSPCSPATSTTSYNLTNQDRWPPYDLLNTTTDNTTSANETGNLTASSPKVLGPEAQGCLIALFSLTVVFSIVGNILVVMVFTHGRRCRTDIRPFLINLAIADLIMAFFCMPFTFTFVFIRTWIFSAPMCPIVLFMQHLSVSASVFTNVAIGIDRFLVVTFPLRARMTSQRAKYIIAVIWTCALGLSSVQLVVARSIDHGTMVDCDEQWHSEAARSTFTIFIMLITYFIPLIILSITYSIVSILLWKRTAPGNAHHGRDLQQLKAKRKVVKMLVLVVTMFGVCWLPLQTFFLVADFNPELFRNQTESQRRAFTIIYYMAFWMAMSNSCANPIVYGFTNDSFRADLAALFYHWFPFCLCFKKLANRQLSMSTCDSAYNRRWIASSRTLKRPLNGGHTHYKQATVRNGSNKVYIELERERNRTLSNKESLGLTSSNGRSRPTLYVQSEPGLPPAETKDQNSADSPEMLPLTERHVGGQRPFSEIWDSVPDSETIKMRPVSGGLKTDQEDCTGC